MTRLLRANYTRSTFYRSGDRPWIRSGTVNRPLLTLTVIYDDGKLAYPDCLFTEEIISCVRYGEIDDIAYGGTDRNINIVENYISTAISRKECIVTEEKKYEKTHFLEETENKNKIYETISVNEMVIYS